MSICETHLVQFIGYSADDGLVSEVEMEPLKIHLPVNRLIAMCLRVKEISYIQYIQCLYFNILYDNKTHVHL